MCCGGRCADGTPAAKSRSYCRCHGGHDVRGVITHCWLARSVNRRDLLRAKTCPFGSAITTPSDPSKSPCRSSTSGGRVTAASSVPARTPATRSAIPRSAVCNSMLGFSFVNRLTTGGMTSLAIEDRNPTRRSSACPRALRVTASMARSAEPRSGTASRSRTSPTAVSVTPRLSGPTTRHRGRDSRTRICADRDCCVMCSRAAARVMLRSSATTRRPAYPEVRWFGHVQPQSRAVTAEETIVSASPDARLALTS